MESKHIIIILIVIILMIASAMIGMFANSQINDKTTPVNNTTNSSVAVTNGTADESQTSDTGTHTETSPTKQNTDNNNKHKHQEDASYVTYYPDEDDGDSSEDSSGYDSEIYVDDRGRVSVGYWDDEGYWNPEYVV